MASVQGLECVCPVDAAPVYQFAESLKDQNKTFGRCAWGSAQCSHNHHLKYDKPGHR